VPIKDAAGFASRLESAVSRCTLPAHSGVRSISITRSDGVEGFVITFIPKSNAAPHQTIGAQQYYMRAGSDFVPVPHEVLAGMFGRRPEPNMTVRNVITPPEIEGDMISFEVGMAVRNRGPGIARDVFLTLVVKSIPCAVGSLLLEAGDLENWTAIAFLNVHNSYLAKPTVRLAPDCYLMPVQLCFRLSPPFTSALDIAVTVGCEGGMPTSFRLYNTGEKIERAYKAIMAAKSVGLLYDESLKRFPTQILGLSEDEVDVHPKNDDHA
jgi:hypothetical protein